MNIFLAFAFRDEDKELVGNIRKLLESHRVVVNTGENLGGKAVTPAVKEEIDNSNALIAVLTREEQLSGDRWTTHTWVVDELNHAIEKGKMAIALLENGISLTGMAASHHHIPLDRSKQMDAILDLSQTIGKWKSKIGRTLKIQILPPSLAARLDGSTQDIKCKYRLWINGVTKTGDWKEAKEARAVTEDSGTFVYVDGVQDDQRVQLRVEDGSAEWFSPAKAQWMQIELSQKKSVSLD